MTPACVLDYRALARRRLPHFLFEYIDGGSYDERTLTANVEALGATWLRQRVLRDVSACDTATTLFGRALSLPVVLAPVGLGGMYARRGEVQAARAAQAAGTDFTLSTVSVCSLAEVTANAGTPPWFQLYVMRDRGVMRALVEQAKAAACPVLVLTVDLPLPGTRWRDARSGLAGGALVQALQGLARPGWLADVGVGGRPHTLGNLAEMVPGAAGLSDFLGWIGANFDPSCDWRLVEEVRALWPGPLVIKGVLEVEDARAALAAGADGIVVSNHGGRQLDGAPATARALPAIADAVGDAMTVMADGGVRSGLDVLRMLALGARAVMVGRAWAWALGARGQAGVGHMLDLLGAELRTGMALTGCTRIADLGPGILRTD